MRDTKLIWIYYNKDLLVLTKDITALFSDLHFLSCFTYHLSPVIDCTFFWTKSCWFQNRHIIYSDLKIMPWLSSIIITTKKVTVIKLEMLKIVLNYIWNNLKSFFIFYKVYSMCSSLYSLHMTQQIWIQWNCKVRAGTSKQARFACPRLGSLEFPTHNNT